MAPGTLALALGCFLTAPASAQPLQAVVPARVIHPGQPIAAGDLRVVTVRNPRPVARPVVRRLEQAVGRVARRTLLPRRYIARAALRVPHLVEAGKAVELRYRSGPVVITRPATALQSGGRGDAISVRAARRTLVGIVAGDGAVEVSR